MRWLVLGQAAGEDITNPHAYRRCRLGWRLHRLAPILRALDRDLYERLLTAHQGMHETIAALHARQPGALPHGEMAQLLARFERQQADVVSMLQRLKTLVLQRTLLRDPLTRLPLRAALMESFDPLRAQSSRRGESVYALLLDLDHFKRINDTWGHAAGDAVLQEVASRLRAQRRRGEPLVRYGGEEFVLLFSAAEHALAQRTAERLLDAVRAKPITFEEQAVTVTVSAGLARHRSEQGETLEHLLQRADLAMYEAKRAGRNTWREAQSS